MSRWRIKQAKCQTCGDSFEWTTRMSDFCKPCRNVLKVKAQEKKRRAMGMKVIASAEKDPLPKQDWAMEKQFSTFYALIGKRYSDIRDVTSVVEANSNKHRQRTGLIHA